jgi:hypothetical protein
VTEETGIFFVRSVILLISDQRNGKLFRWSFIQLSPSKNSYCHVVVELEAAKQFNQISHTDEFYHFLDDKKTRLPTLLSGSDWQKSLVRTDFFIVTLTSHQEKLHTCLAFKENMAFTLLGNGLNLILKDGGIRSILMNLRQLTDIKIDDTNICLKRFKNH